MIIGWLVLVAAVYSYIYSSGWLNNVVQATSEMTRFQSALLNEEAVYGAGVSIHNFHASDDSEDSRTLSVVLKVKNICTESDDTCKEFTRDIAAKTLNEYPEIDSFTHLSIGVQQNKRILLIINFSKTFIDSKTIAEWREEIQ